MGRSHSKISSWFIITALVLLILGMIFGLTGAFQYIVPGAFKEHLSFEKTRPLHVTSVLFWIILAASGSILSYLPSYTGKKFWSAKLLFLQYSLFIIAIVSALLSYCLGIFGGREYWEFPPAISVFIAAGWILFLINFVKSVPTFRKQPVYVWMWLTGLVFFLFTFAESYLWIIPYFRANIISDMTIQWKSYGSMVGSWNMIIYGSSFYLMEKISGSDKYSQSTIAFILYFTGLFNLMFNWGHHIYTLPTHHYVKYISYGVSMTELIILGRIIYLWKDSVSTARKHFHHLAYRFLLAADAWILFTLVLAILMSVPGINLYTHGTHVTVAHTMGATIGINSMLLLAITINVLGNSCKPISQYSGTINKGFWISNISLFIFCISLIVAGIIKSGWQMSDNQVPFSSMMKQLHPYFLIFFISGITMFIGFLLVVIPVLRNQFSCLISRSRFKSARQYGYQLPSNPKTELVI